MADAMKIFRLLPADGYELCHPVTQDGFEVFNVDHKVKSTGFSRSALAAKIVLPKGGLKWNTDTAVIRFFRSNTTLYG